MLCVGVGSIMCNLVYAHIIPLKSEGKGLIWKHGRPGAFLDKGRGPAIPFPEDDPENQMG